MMHTSSEKSAYLDTIADQAARTGDNHECTGHYKMTHPDTAAPEHYTQLQ